jgi:hypothetical protein
LSVEIFKGVNKNNKDVVSYTLALATTEKANSDDMNTVDGESSNSDDIGITEFPLRYIALDLFEK